MITKIAGDTIVFEANLTDADGTAITNASGTVTVVDAIGSTVLSGVATHTATGTYQRGNSTSGWANGPITEYWRFTNGAGTTTQIVGNKFRIIGTSTLQPYAYPHELYGYYENVENYFDGSEFEKVYDSFTFINQQLAGLGYNLPIAKGTFGLHDQALRDWNAWDSVYRIVSPRALSQSKSTDEGHWFDYFKKKADSIWDQFRTKKIVLEIQTSPGEAGIMPGTKIAGTLKAQMENNWQGYGKGFLGDDYPRTWRIEILGTGTAGELTEGTFRWSRDDGVTWDGTCNTTTTWQHLDDEVYIRFHRGTNTGTTGMYTTADTWQFRTAPIKLSTGGKFSVKSIGI